MRAFAYPFAFALLVVVIALLVAAWRERRGRAGAFLFSSIALVGRVRGARLMSSWIPLLLQAAGLSLLVVALARPQEITTSSSERFGIDLVIALDGSGSMGAEDFQPDRFTAAKELIASFVDGRENDRVGLVIFGGRAATRVPVTYDREVVKKVLAAAAVSENGDGTAIGHAIATAVNRLKGSTSRSRVIVLLTDGVNNAGSIEPATAAELAAKFGVKIYAIGVGSRGITYAPVKMQDPITGEIVTDKVPIRADLDEQSLRSIARATGGEYFRAVDPATLGAIFERIDHLEKSRLSAPKRESVRELYVPPLAWALALLVAAYILGESLWMRLPA